MDENINIDHPIFRTNGHEAKGPGVGKSAPPLAQHVSQITGAEDNFMKPAIPPVVAAEGGSYSYLGFGDSNPKTLPWTKKEVK